MAIGGRTKGRSASAVADEPAGSVNYEDIARVAYELFVQRGGEHGHDQEDWFEAERLVRARGRSSRAARSA